MKIYRVLSMIIVTVLVLSACNMPSTQPTEQVNPNAVFTAAAQTVVAQLTQGALLNPTSPPPTVAPPTNTPSAPTNTPQTLGGPTNTSAPVVVPTTGCDAAQFITDVTIPDGTSFAAGATFVKTLVLAPGVHPMRWYLTQALPWAAHPAFHWLVPWPLVDRSMFRSTCKLPALTAPIKVSGGWPMLQARASQLRAAPVEDPSTWRSRLELVAEHRIAVKNLPLPVSLSMLLLVLPPVLQVLQSRQRSLPTKPVR
jgi:hypothetical protein